MAEYIECRNCDSHDCKGCNLKNLETMLNNGKFDCMMNENRCINPAADVAPVRHGRWEEADWVEPDCHGFGTIITPKAALRCSNCKNCFKKELLWKDNYCPNCGTDMRGSNDE